METNFISAIEIMASASMDFLKFNTETGQAGSTEIWIFLKVFELDSNSRHNWRLMEIWQST